MRKFNVLALALVTPPVIAFLVPPFVGKALSSPPSESQLHHLSPAQAAMNPEPVQPPFSSQQPQSGGNGGDGTSNSLTISDILPKTRSINIFASLTRDVPSVSDRLESNDQSRDNTTLLAPLNSVMQGLPRKPWEDKPSQDSKQAPTTSNEERAAQNIQTFVQHHIIPVSPWKQGKDGKAKSLGGKELWWEERGDKRYIMPDDLLVDSVVGRVGNGEVWAIKGVIDY